jgi:T4 superinfection immunity protein
MHLLGFFFFPFFGFGFLCYFLPTIVALIRERHDRFAIFMLNFFLGWSLIGWVIALAWACKSDRVVYVQNPQRY